MSKTYTTFDIAKMTDVYPTTVADWFDNGKLKAFLLKFSMPIPEELNTLKEKSILIVDDEKDLARIISRSIEQIKELKNYKTYIATDGFQAGHMYTAHEPDLVVLDVMLPGIDGIKVCELIRKYSSKVKILAITGYPSEENKKKIISAGADSFMQKPFNIKDLSGEIIRLINMYEKGN